MNKNSNMMKAICYVKPYTVEFREVAKPVLEQDTDVVVKISVSSICGSDLHVFRGNELMGKEGEGTVMGHEFCGQVEQVGSAVTKFKVGDKVVSPFTTCCGECYFCQNELSCRCVKGRLYGWEGFHGGQAEFVRVPMADSTLFPLPEGLNIDQGLLMGDILATGFFCAVQGNITKKESVVVVVGCGPVGLMAVASAAHLGKDKNVKIIAVDCVEERLEAAKSLGASMTLNFKNDDVPALVRANSKSGMGADVVLEVVGQPSAMKLAYTCLAPGGCISSVGVHAYETFQITPEEAYNKNITFKSGRCPVRSLLGNPTHLENMTAVLSSIKPDVLFTHRLKLSEGVKAYDVFNTQSDRMIKCLLYN